VTCSSPAPAAEDPAALVQPEPPDPMELPNPMEPSLLELDGGGDPSSDFFSPFEDELDVPTFLRRSAD
jgi:hypothetical protein